MSGRLRHFLGRLNRFWQGLDFVEWPCEHCGQHNETSRLIWADIRFRLICRRCFYQQAYPGYIDKLDPMRGDRR